MSKNTQKFLCDGCRSMFTVAELRVHLGFDEVEARAKSSELNPRGNRLSTAPVFNVNDSRMFLERCPSRNQRVGRAGPLRADLTVMGSLPVVLPYALGKLELEELKDRLLQNWTDHQALENKKRVMADIELHGKEAVPPSASSALRPRAGRNVLLDDDVQQMNREHKQRMQANVVAAGSPPVASVSATPRPTAKPVVVPSYMKPLQRVKDAAVEAHRCPQAHSASGRAVHVDPQTVSQERVSGKGAGGYVRVSSGQVVPFYVKL